MIEGILRLARVLARDANRARNAPMQFFASGFYLPCRVLPRYFVSGFLFAMNDQPLIKIESVSKLYGSTHTGVFALRDVSLDIRAGEFVSIIGPSGCGKSTLLKMIGDLVAPSAGYITIDGHAPGEARRVRACGIVFQSPTLMDWRTIAHNIALPLEVMGASPSERETRAHEMLDLIRLREFGARYPHELSLGMQQQVAIARALASRPAILLMDEPFGSLDEITRERLGYELLDVWQRARVTVVFVTHSVSEAVFLSDRVAVFTPRPGRLARVVPIDLPRPRNHNTRDLPRYAELVRQVRGILHTKGAR